MWISTKAQYGLRALTEMARCPGSPLPLKDIAERQDISQHYLEQIAANLRRAGFIRSVRGARGGYQLARAPEQINTWDVVVALEGSLAPVACIEDDLACGRTDYCSTVGLWRRVDQAVRGVLGSATLADLLLEEEQTQMSRLVQLETPPQSFNAS